MSRASKLNQVAPFDVFIKKVRRRQRAKASSLESVIEKDVKEFARSAGVLVRKYVSTAFPSVPDDIFFFDQGVSVLIEFKRLGKKPSLKQAQEIHRLVKRGHLVYVIDQSAAGICLVQWFVTAIHEGWELPTIKPLTEAEWQRLATTKGKPVITG